MKNFAIFGDTSQDLTYELGEKYGIEVIPYTIQMGERHLKDLEDISSREFYQTLDQYDTLSTGTPPLQDVIDRLDKVKAQGVEEVLLITSCAQLTSMYSLYGTIKSHYEGLDLHLFDTDSIGAGAGIISIYAGLLKEKGKSLEEIVQELNRVKGQGSLHALFRTLKYLVKGGRFNKYKGALGMLLNINPLLKVENKEIVVKDKVRGQKGSLSALTRAVKEELEGAKSYYIILFSGDNEEELVELRAKLADQIQGAQVYLETEFTPVLGVHAGPKSIGVATLKLD